jgi:hypothetical protein
MGLEFTSLRYFIPTAATTAPTPREAAIAGYALGPRGRHSEASLGRNSKIRKPDYLRDVA